MKIRDKLELQLNRNTTATTLRRQGYFGKLPHENHMVQNVCQDFDFKDQFQGGHGNSGGGLKIDLHQ